MENFFVSDFNTYKKNLEERNWKVSTLFDRDARKVPGSKSATNKNIDEGIKAIISKLKTGDQFLLTFHSHGMKSDAKIPSHHSIVSEDVDGYSLQKLDAYADEAKRKGATIAVVDLSCYSGNTQVLNNVPKGADERGCVVSLASEKYISICSGSLNSNSFSESFFKLPHPSVAVNLEDHFLKSREKDISSTNLPQISSIVLPEKNFWDFFLSEGDPSNSRRGKDFQVARPAGALCKFCEGIKEHVPELSRLLKFAQELEGETFQSQLWSAILDYIGTDVDLTKMTNTIQEKLGSKPSWGFKEKALAHLNREYLSNMENYARFTDPKLDLGKIKWLDDETRDKFIRLRPYHKKIRAAYQKMSDYLQARQPLYYEQFKLRQHSF
ncbi:MAG TPA: hypothetical protein PLU50_00585 [Pseudobdellovibrionaceae bacterium]|nr:hypothetical protein [Pseudobdellovibrionaceae bacterium]